MNEPFIWIGIHKVRQGKTEELKSFLRDLPGFVEEREPRLLGFHIYLSEDGTRVAVVQIHPDADSFEFHMKVAGKHIAESYQYLEATESTWIFGEPSPAVLEMVEQVRQAADQRQTLSVMSHPLAGFTRFGSVAPT
jgi:hypothetical protein